VDTVVVSGASDTTALVRTAEGWRVNGHRAAREEISALLGELGDTSRLDLVAESPTSHARLGVSTDSGRRLRTAGGTPLELIVGARSGGFSGGYARQPEANAVYQLRGRLPALLARSPDEWRDRTIAAIPADSVAEVEVVRGRVRYALRRDGSSWRFASGGRPDSAKVADLVRDLGRISASGFASASQIDSARFARPDRRLAIKGPGGRTLLALAFDSTGDAILVRHDSGGTVWRMESWETDRITPAASNLR
jgi:hypothetical protein